MDKPHADRERRKQRRFEQMGTNNPVCLSCGYTGWHNFHGHHIAGKRYDPDAIEYFCTRCHGDLSEEQRDHPAPISKKSGPVERGGHYCLGLSLIMPRIARMIAYHSQKLSGTPNETDTREASLYFRALAKFVERTAPDLNKHGIKLTDEARKAASRKGKNSKPARVRMRRDSGR